MIHPSRSYIKTDYGSLGYCRAGSGPPVILVHGALLTADDMVIALMQRLSDHYDVVAFDRPGHGASDQTAYDVGSPHIQGDAIAAGWSALGIRQPLVVGHSFGGAVAISLAISRPDEVTGVIALAPICFPEPRLEQLIFGPRGLPYVGKHLAFGLGRLSDLATLPVLRNTMFLPQVMPSNMADQYPFGWASAASMMIADAQDSLAIWRGLSRSAWSYAHCRTPTHIIAGTHDLVVANMHHGFAACHLMPSATFEWIWGCGHMLHHFHQSTIEGAIAAMWGREDRDNSILSLGDDRSIAFDVPIAASAA